MEVLNLQTHYEKIKQLGYEPIYVGLRGSQNYGLSNENSDIDSIGLIMPKLENLALEKKRISEDIEFEDGGKCTIKDIRDLPDLLLKQNHSFLEILFGDYFCTNKFSPFFEELRSRGEEISRYNPLVFLKAVKGTMIDNYKKMLIMTAANSERFQKLGYDYKKLYQVVRLRELAEKYSKGLPLKECLQSTHSTYLMRIKEGEISFEDAEIIAETELEKIDTVIGLYGKLGETGTNFEIEIFLNEWLVRLFKFCFVEV